MEDFHGDIPWTTDAASFNAGATADDHHVQPYPYQTHQVPSPPRSNAGSWWNSSIHMDPYDSSHVSFDHRWIAPSFPNVPAVPVTYEPSFSLHGNYHPVNPYYLPPPVGPFETQHAQDHVPTHLMPTAPNFQNLVYSHPPPVLPLAEHYRRIARDSPSYAAQVNFGTPASVASANPWIGHENTVAETAQDYSPCTNAHSLFRQGREKDLDVARTSGSWS
ncbi:hypothetical protein BT69DRAFT_60642 [Atractiella rhizophila]|nr:hypothetical protein BT69DRAFT_60642 [Atractiella rhizophila]